MAKERLSEYELSTRKEVLRRLEIVKNKFNSLSDAPVMDIDGDYRTLQNMEDNAISSYGKHYSHSRKLSSQFSQAYKALANEENNLYYAQKDLASKQSTLNSTQYSLSNIQCNLTSKQNNLATLQSKLNGQQALVSKIHGYLSDYQENSASTTGMVENDQLAAKLIGELAQLNLE
ncbi:MULTISPECIES: hypothetical protein [unclassified Candidatus Tisiphia]|uniref:hypothetical protein n=1 Tax=unclassified Candidatus Tisiphia TaxID=2996318 RepID=UPI003CCAE435